MREALAQAQKPLAMMKDHMAQCMSMMQQMQGGMDSHMQQKKE
jgi:fructose/tagatose bisphosphate aldolase